MSFRFMLSVVFLALAMCLSACEKTESPTRKVTYKEDVAPIINEYCVECHIAGQPGALESGLLMDSYESLMKGSQVGPVVQPGNAVISSLYLLVSGQSELVVAMPHGKESLAPDEVETIRVWIEGGAVEN